MALPAAVPAEVRDSNDVISVPEITSDSVDIVVFKNNNSENFDLSPSATKPSNFFNDLKLGQDHYKDLPHLVLEKFEGHINKLQKIDKNKCGNFKIDKSFYGKYDDLIKAANELFNNHHKLVETHEDNDKNAAAFFEVITAIGSAPLQLGVAITTLAQNVKENIFEDGTLDFTSVISGGADIFQIIGAITEIGQEATKLNNSKLIDLGEILGVIGEPTQILDYILDIFNSFKAFLSVGETVENHKKYVDSYIAYDQVKNSYDSTYKQILENTNDSSFYEINIKAHNDEPEPSSSITGNVIANDTYQEDCIGLDCQNPNYLTIDSLKENCVYKVETLFFDEEFINNQDEFTFTLSENGDFTAEPKGGFKGIVGIPYKLTVSSKDGEVSSSDTATLTLNFGDDEDLVNPPDNGKTVGDPHFTTFDGKYYNYQGVGEFTLVKSQTDDFEIQVRQEPLSGSYASVNSAVAMSIDGERIGLYKRREPLIINGVSTELESGESLAVGSNIVSRKDNSFTIISNNQDKITVSLSGDYINVNVGLSLDRQNNVIGLLGNNNDDLSDEFALRDGTLIGESISTEQLYGEYADSWRIEQSESLFDYLPGEDTNTFTDTSYPPNVFSIDDLTPEQYAEAEFLAKQNGITDPDLLKAAIFDIVVTNGDPEFIEGAVEQQEFIDNSSSGEDTQDNIIIQDPENRDALTGTDENEQFIGYQGRDIIISGGGNDEIIYTSIVDAGDTITDFEVGKDKINFSELLDSFNYNGSDPFLDGYLQIMGHENSSIIAVDTDGLEGIGRPRQFILVQDVSVEQLQNPSNFIL